MTRDPDVDYWPGPPEPMPPTLHSWLAWIDQQCGSSCLNCICPHQWKGSGILHGVSMGKEWARLTTEPECPEHGDST